MMSVTAIPFWDTEPRSAELHAAVEPITGGSNIPDNGVVRALVQLVSFGLICKMSLAACKGNL